MVSGTGDSSSNAESRAVKIPQCDALEAYSYAAPRRRRSARHHALANLSDSPGMEPSSFSSENSSPASSLRAYSSRTRSRTTPYSRTQSGESLSQDDFAGFTPPRSSKLKDKAVDHMNLPSTMPCLVPSRSSPLGPSMLSCQTYKSINLNGSDPDEPPRLITFTKACQGFNWNEDLFLPSYMISRYSRGRRKQYDGDMGEDDVDVAEIFVTDEEANNMMP